MSTYFLHAKHGNSICDCLKILRGERHDEMLAIGKKQALIISAISAQRQCAPTPLLLALPILIGVQAHDILPGQLLKGRKKRDPQLCTSSRGGTGFIPGCNRFMCARGRLPCKTDRRAHCRIAQTKGRLECDSGAESGADSQVDSCTLRSTQTRIGASPESS